MAAADSCLRFAWPFLTMALRTGFERSAASSYAWTLPEYDGLAECSICLTTSSGACVLPCGHSFHRSCIAKWFESVHSTSVCPICRQKLPNAPMGKMRVGVADQLSERRRLDQLYSP